MITVLCTTCNAGVRVVGEFAENDSLFGSSSEWYPDKYPCRNTGCSGNAKIVAPAELRDMPESLDIVELSPQEAFAAFFGLGVPEERICTGDAVRSLFETPVESVDVKDIPRTNRCTLNSVEFEDGTRLFLAPSRYGAVVYKIKRPNQSRPQLKEVSNV